MSSIFRANRGLTLAFATMTAVSVAAVAQTNGSPFASKKKKQAWETDVVRPGPSASPYQAPSYQAPVYEAPKYIPPPNYTPPADIKNSAPPIAPSTQSYAPASSYSAPQNYSAPSPSTPSSSAQPPAAAYAAPSYTAPAYSGPKTTPSVAAQTAPAYGSYNPQKYSAAPSKGGGVEPDLLPGYRRQVPGQAGTYYPGRADPSGFSVPAYAPRGQTAQNKPGPQFPAQNYPNQNYTAQNYSGQNYSGQNNVAAAAPSSYPNHPNNQGYGGPNQRPQYAPQSWKDRLGLGNLLTTFSAALKVGVAALRRTDTIEDEGWRAGFIADGKISGEVSAITRGGLEYGLGGEVRGQYDKYRRGFGGKVGDCGVGAVEFIPGCNSVIVDGLAQPLRGHTSQFYSAGLDNAKEVEFALEGAYLFLRSAYGDVTVGRDDGAAYLFSLGAPSLLAVNASNSPVDYTGLDSVRTVNEASGFSEKISYVSPRLLGDQIGLGVQIGASYAFDARACGVDYCVRSNGSDSSTALSPDLNDVLEFGISLDRTFRSGLSIEGTATYATASEDSGIAGFDDLKSYGVGLEAKYGPWTLGGSFLNSNNGLIDGDYEAYDVGLTFKPAKWGVSASYGHANDKNVNLLSDQATLGFIYDFDRFTLGTGVQYIKRDVVGIDGGIFAPRSEKAAALFVEGGVKF